MPLVAYSDASSSEDDEPVVKKTKQPVKILAFEKNKEEEEETVKTNISTQKVPKKRKGNALLGLLAKKKAQPIQLKNQPSMTEQEELKNLAKADLLLEESLAKAKHADKIFMKMQTDGTEKSSILTDSTYQTDKSKGPAPGKTSYMNRLKLRRPAVEVIEADIAARAAKADLMQQAVLEKYMKKAKPTTKKEEVIIYFRKKLKPFHKISTSPSENMFHRNRYNWHKITRKRRRYKLFQLRRQKANHW